MHGTPMHNAGMHTGTFVLHVGSRGVASDGEEGSIPTVNLILSLALYWVLVDNGAPTRTPWRKVWSVWTMLRCCAALSMHACWALVANEGWRHLQAHGTRCSWASTRQGKARQGFTITYCRGFTYGSAGRGPAAPTVAHLSSLEQQEFAMSCT